MVSEIFKEPKFVTLNWPQIKSMIPELEGIFEPGHKIKPSEIAYIYGLVFQYHQLKGYKLITLLAIERGAIFLFKRKFRLW